MRRYIEQLHTKDPHERRAHAMRVALGITGAIFFVWITTLSVRLASQSAQVAEGDGSSQVANVISGAYAPNTLEVAPTQNP